LPLLCTLYPHSSFTYLNYLMPLPRRRSLEQQPQHPPNSSRSRPASPLHNGAPPLNQSRSHFYGLANTASSSYASTPTMNRSQTLPDIAGGQGKIHDTQREREGGKQNFGPAIVISSRITLCKI
jgi:hypothetical protein